MTRQIVGGVVVGGLAVAAGAVLWAPNFWSLFGLLVTGGAAGALVLWDLA